MDGRSPHLVVLPNAFFQDFFFFQVDPAITSEEISKSTTAGQEGMMIENFQGGLQPRKRKVRESCALRTLPVGVSTAERLNSVRCRLWAGCTGPVPPSQQLRGDPGAKCSPLAGFQKGASTLNFSGEELERADGPHLGGIYASPEEFHLLE